jgi:hypothetical protein
MSKPYNAMPFEAVKVSLRQNREGVMVSFVVHPDDIQPFLLTDPVGTRYQLVAVRLGDGVEIAQEGAAKALERTPGRTTGSGRGKGTPGEKSPGNPLEVAQQNVVASAGILCRDKRFQDWVGYRRLVAKSGSTPVTVWPQASEVEAVEWLLEQCGVKSRVALKTNEVARANFFGVRKSFDAWAESTPPF